MKSSNREVQEIVDYMASQAQDDNVEHLEKVSCERVAGRKYCIWDVHTESGRYWVITDPINWYPQEQFPNMDIALTFHIGLMLRVLERSPFRPSPGRLKRLAEPMRRLDQASEALSRADEADEFQAIGMRCRESLIALVHEASSSVVIPEGVEAPKASDYIGWSNLLADIIAGGSSAERRRSYLKGTAKVTWDFVNWLTHAANATFFDAVFALEATGWIISTFAFALVRLEHGHPDRCPRCASYKLSMVYQTDPDDPNRGEVQLKVCDICGWESEPTLASYEGPRRRGLRKRKSVDLDECIVVEVPLRGPKPPMPSF
jgi:hypothetical protein